MGGWNRVSNTPTRLKEALTKSNMRQAELSRRTGLDKGTISNYLSGRYEPKSDAINKMAIALNVSEMWLWGYDIPMERKEKNSPDKTMLTEGEKKWLELYHQISDESKVILTNMVGAFDKLPTDKQKFLLDAVRIALGNQK